MKRLLIIIPVILLLLVPSIVSAAASWESYTSGDNAAVDIYGVNWYGQTFTAGPASHSSIEVRFLGYRVGSPSTMTASLRHVGDDGMPTDTDITSGTLDGDALTTDTAGSWYGVSLTEVNLVYGDEYAICLRAEAGDDSNYIAIREDTTGAYADGQSIMSVSAGITWTAVTGHDILFEVTGNYLMEVYGAKVFQSYLEDNDMLILLSYRNTYVPYYPNDVCSLRFWLQLRTTDGVTILAQTVCQQWGYQPGSIYLNANQAGMITTGFPYRIYLAGASSENATAYYALKSGDWYGNALTLIPAWVITTAHGMASYYGTTMTTQVQNKEILNSEGGTLFATGIPSLIVTNPDLFQDKALVPVINPITSSNASTFYSATTWQDILGPDITGTANDIGNIGGVGGDMAIAFILFIAYIIICLIVVGKGGDAFVASLLCIPILLLAAYLRVIDVRLIASVGSVAVIMTVFRFAWSRT